MGCKRTHKGLICSKSGKNPLKSGQKWRPTFAEKQVKTIILEATLKNGRQKQ